MEDSTTSSSTIPGDRTKTEAAEKLEGTKEQRELAPDIVEKLTRAALEQDQLRQENEALKHQLAFAQTGLTLSTIDPTTLSGAGAGPGPGPIPHPLDPVVSLEEDTQGSEEGGMRRRRKKCNKKKSKKRNDDSDEPHESESESEEVKEGEEFMGDEKVPKTRPNSYSLAYKLMVIGEYEKDPRHDIARLAEKHHIDRSAVYDWLENRAEIRRLVEGGAKGKRLKGGGRKVVNEEIDASLYSWITEQLLQGVRITRRDVLLYARRTYAGSGLLFSSGWMYKYMQRHHLFYYVWNNNRYIGVGKREQSCAVWMGDLCGYILRRPELQHFAAVEEVDVIYEADPKLLGRYPGRMSVYGSAPYSIGHHCLVVLCTSSTGQKLPPFLIFRHKAYPQVPKNSDPKPTSCPYSYSASGRLEPATFLEWLNKVWTHGLQLQEAGQTCLLISRLDCYQGSLDKLALSFFLPEDTLDYLRPFKKAIYADFQETVKKQWGDWVMHNNTPDRHLTTRPAKAVLTKWVADAWESVSAESITKEYNRIFGKLSQIVSEAVNRGPS